MISVRSLTKRFGRAGTRNAVDGISFTIPDGKLFTLLGQSGCGKSTTLRMIAGIEEPTSGEICLGDRLVYSKRKRARMSRSTIGRSAWCSSPTPSGRTWTCSITSPFP